MQRKLPTPPPRGDNFVPHCASQPCGGICGTSFPHPNQGSATPQSHLHREVGVRGREVAEEGALRAMMSRRSAMLLGRGRGETEGWKGFEQKVGDTWSSGGV